MLEPLVDPPLPYASRDEQHQASILGMWVFLGTEVMLFGGLITALVLSRAMHPQAFEAASHRMDLVAGALNTFVLLTSSLTMALGVRAANGHRPRTAGFWLVVTAVLGVGFLVIKGLEYAHHIQSGLLPGAGFALTGPWAREEQLFFVFYFLTTGLHALHLTIGVVLVTGLGVWAGRRRALSPLEAAPVEMAGLYWHLVDIVWIFLFPLLYLIGHH